MTDLIVSIAVLCWWRVKLLCGGKQLSVSAKNADCLLRVCSQWPEQRLLVERILEAKGNV